MKAILHRKTLIVAVTLLFLGAFITVANANHSWGGYHWARTSNPFTLKLGNNTSGTWTSLLGIASSDWSLATVLDTTIVAGGTKPKVCRPTNGRVEVCNASYGNTGWLGVAQVWITGGTHITQGTVKNNDYYFNSASTYPYKNEAEKLHVICQEIGHTLGLDHQSTDGSSLDTCMDYYHNTSGTDILSTHPNAHDYEELGLIYGHFDSADTVFATASAKGNNADVATDDPSGWGKEIRHDSRGHSSIFERDLGAGNKVFTFVIWTQE